MSADEKHNFIGFEADGYFFDALKMPMPTPDELSNLISTSGGRVREILLVQFMFRTSILLYNEATPDTVEAVNHLSRMYLLIALKHAESLIADPPLPFELSHRPEEIRAKLRAKNARVDDFTVGASIDPRFSAWTDLDRRRVTISWVTREVLYKFNLMLWNRIFMTTDALASGSAHSWNLDEEVGQLLSAFVPYLALEYRELDYMAAPFPGAYDDRVLENARDTTADQLYFLLSHEFAHVALHSGTEIMGARRKIEDDADALALELTIGRAHGNSSDAYTSITWLFQYLALSRLAGALLNDHPDPVSCAKEVGSRARMDGLNDLIAAGEVAEIDLQCTSLGCRYLYQMSLTLIELKKEAGERFDEVLGLDKLVLPDARQFYGRVLRSATLVSEWNAQHAVKKEQ